MNLSGNKIFDVIVIGAGPGGSTAAHLLARHGLHVLLVDKVEFPRDKTCGDGLTPRAVAMLQYLGLESELAGESRRIENIKVFSPSGREIDVSIPSFPGLPPYLLTVPRLDLDQAIKNLATNSGAVFACPVNVSTVTRDGAVMSVAGRYLEGVGSNNKRLFNARGRVIIVATGANLRLPERVGLLEKRPRLVLAARTYYESANHIANAFEFHFDGVRLPGYGWIFPIAGSKANVGVGIFDKKKKARRKIPSAKTIMHEFLEHPSIRAKLAGAGQIGPIRGYPIRTDFTSSSTVGRGILAVGEAAGLVNPLTGEGIDYALESGKIAAEHLIACFEAGDISARNLTGYDQTLRLEFQKLFRFCEDMLYWTVRRPILDGLVAMAARRQDLRHLLTSIVLGTADKDQLSRRSLLRSIISV